MIVDDGDNLTAVLLKSPSVTAILLRSFAGTEEVEVELSKIDVLSFDASV